MEKSAVQTVGSEVKSVDAFFDENPSIRYIRLHWVDYSGVLRTRFVPKDRFLRLVTFEDSYSLAQNCMIIPVATAPECWPPGPERWELRLDATSPRMRLC